MPDILNVICHFKKFTWNGPHFYEFPNFSLPFLVGIFLPTAVIDISFNFNCECISRLSAEKILNKKCTG